MQNKRSNGFVNASLILGVCALLSSMILPIILPMLLGGLAIVLGILSRGCEKRLHSLALVGVITACSALIINLCIGAMSLLLIFTNPSMTQEYMDILSSSYEQMTGMSLDEITGGLLPDTNTTQGE